MRRLALVLGVFALAVGLLAGATHWLTREAASIDRRSPSLAEAPPAGREQASFWDDDRAVYPYSVVPGGVLTPEELEAAAKRDPVIREHYKDLDLAQLRPAALNSDRFAYVSYRIGDNVYWTKNKLRLAKGELVLTGACDAVRGRCGNRLSDVPMTPVAEVEPSEEVLNTAALAEPLRAEARPEDPEEKVLEAPLLDVAPSPAGAPIAFAPGHSLWPKPWWLVGPLLAVAPFLVPEPNPVGPAATPPTDGPGVVEDPPVVPPGPPVDPPGPPGNPPGTPSDPPPGDPPVEPPKPPVSPPSQPPADPPTGPPSEPPTGPPGDPPTGPPSDPPPGPPSDPPPGPPPNDPPWAPPPGPPPGPPPSDPPTDPPPSQPPDFPPVTPVPEPSFYALMGVGLAGLMFAVRRRARK
jgi:hypothetical protein